MLGFLIKSVVAAGKDFLHLKKKTTVLRSLFHLIHDTGLVIKTFIG